MNKMLDPRSLDALASEVADWEANEVAAFLKKQAERKPAFFTTGDIPVKRAYTAADMEALFDGIDLENISVSMTINPSAWILLAMYIALAKKRGLDLDKLSGTVQADILKEYMAQKEYCYPIGPSVRIVRDCITYCAE